MKKCVSVLRAWFLKEEGKISISKMLATLATLCGLVVALQAQLVSAGITVSPEMLPYFKIAGVISAMVALIRTRNNQISSNQQTPTPPVDGPAA
jgi:hypothetical protein